TLATAAILSNGAGATFSDRIWANQVELRNEVNQAIEGALIRGEHPRRASTSIKQLIRDEYGKKQRAAERILITETARAQTIAARESFKDAGIDKYIWIAEPGACPDCAALNGQTFSVDKFNVSVPRHPWCRCSIAAYVD